MIEAFFTVYSKSWSTALRSCEHITDICMKSNTAKGLSSFGTLKRSISLTGGKLSHEQNFKPINAFKRVISFSFRAGQSLQCFYNVSAPTVSTL